MSRRGWVLGAVNALIYAFLLAPLLVVIVVSFGDAAFLQFPPRRLSLRWYRDVTEYPDFVASFWLSLVLAAATTAVSGWWGPLAPSRSPATASPVARS